MRTPRSLVGLILGLGLGLPSALYAADTTKPDLDRIAALIADLGSLKFTDREAASRELDAAGAVALTALKEAAKGEDLEVRYRAEELVLRIEKRLETARILAPTRVHLVYEETPVAEAVADLARQSGYPISLEGDRSRLADRKVTLDTGETTFWQALDLLCQRAGLIESHLAGNPRTGAPVPAREPALEQRLRILRERGGSPTVSGQGRLSLVEGTAPILPTHYAGAVRVRVLPPHTQVPGQAAGAGEALVVLETAREPKLHLNPIPGTGFQTATVWVASHGSLPFSSKTIDVHIDKAVDEKGQVLTQPYVLPAAPAVDAEVVQVLLMEQTLRVPVNQAAAIYQQIPVRLTLADQPSKVLKICQGMITPEVQTPSQPLVIVDNILKAKGQTVRGPDGSAITVIEVSRQDNGIVQLQVQVESGGSGPGLNQVALLNRRMIVRGLANSSGSPGASNLSLVDARGQLFKMLAHQVTETGVNPNAFSQQMHLTFQPPDQRAEPAKLVLSGTRTVKIEIPFDFQDVPLR
jgi:hypothetical protein